MSDNREKLLDQIKEQGDLVRKVKAAKEPKQKVKKTVMLEFTCYKKIFANTEVR